MARTWWQSATGWLRFAQCRLLILFAKRLWFDHADVAVYATSFSEGPLRFITSSRKLMEGPIRLATQSWCVDAVMKRQAITTLTILSEANTAPKSSSDIGMS